MKAKELEIGFSFVNDRYVANRRNTAQRKIRKEEIKDNSLEVAGGVFLMLAILFGAGSVYWIDSSSYWYAGGVIALICAVIGVAILRDKN
ncbi:MAG: hypothetical protein Q4B26_10990 [Eubacteriales bacterium]|nr:hypothetical protein [Eubacteriales bacterium]